MNHFALKNNQGFTLIETLVAIAVLMISIAGPLTIANKALTSALYAKDQSIASNLGQESIEMIKNIKNNNLVNSITFLNTIDGGAGKTCIGDNGKCDVEIDSGSFVIKPDCSSGCPIYFSDTSGYSHNVGGTKTIFTRYYYLTNVNKKLTGLPDPSDYMVTVVVQWYEGKVPNEVRLRGEIVNALQQ